MVFLVIVAFVIIAAGSGAVLLLTRVRQLASVAQSNASVPDANRYRPMLRLLSDEDRNIAGVNRELKGKIGKQRRELFRGYLRCLTKDYGNLLAGIRRTMVESGVDRPDLAKALAKNRLMFALALCRIELSLQLHALGLGKVDVSGLVEALDALRSAVQAMTPATAAI